MSSQLKFSLIIFLLFLSYSVNAQRNKKKGNPEPEPQKYVKDYEINIAYDANSLMHGPYSYYFKEKLQAKGAFNHGKRVGFWEYRPDDTVRFSGSYNENGEYHGNWKYYSNEKLITDLYYNEGSLDGHQRCYFENGKPALIAKYVNGRRDSVYTTFYENGQIKMLIDFENKQYSGRCISYDEKGNILCQIEFKEGYPFNIVKTAKETRYFNGTLINGNGSFIENIEQGDSILIKSKRNFSNGLPSGEFLINKNNGQPSVKGQFENGYMIGNWVKYPNSDNQKNPILRNYSVDDKISTDTLLLPKFENFDEKQLLAFQIGPKFPGGDKGMVRFLAMRSGYPSSAREYGGEGTVYMRFVVEPDGSVSNIEMMKIIGFEALVIPKNNKKSIEELNKEMRADIESACNKAIKTIPYWSPGFQDGLPVRVRIVVPMKFRIQ